ncbi:hypothetical protein F7207_06390 [Helicobacter pylori]|nr:hypothetical protein [Helicobacter pylori]
MDFLGVKNWLQLPIGSKTLFLGSFAGGFNVVLRASVRVRSFCSCIACVISLSSLKLFSVSLFCIMFLFSFYSQTPFFRRLVSLKMR